MADQGPATSHPMAGLYAPRTTALPGTPFLTLLKASALLRPKSEKPALTLNWGTWEPPVPKTLSAVKGVPRLRRDL